MPSFKDKKASQKVKITDGRLSISKKYNSPDGIIIGEVETKTISKDGITITIIFNKAVK